MVAEGVGFEPTRACALPVFKTGAINHSTTPPEIFGWLILTFAREGTRLDLRKAGIRPSRLLTPEPRRGFRRPFRYSISDFGSRISDNSHRATIYADKAPIRKAQTTSDK